MVTFHLKHLSDITGLLVVFAVFVFPLKTTDDSHTGGGDAGMDRVLLLLLCSLVNSTRRLLQTQETSACCCCSLIHMLEKL